MIMKKVIIFILLFNSLIYAASYENAKHAVGIDFGTTIFSAATLPGIANLIFKPQNGSTEPLFKGGFGIAFTYNYAYLPKQAIDAFLGIYSFNAHYNGTMTVNGASSYQKIYNADVVVIPASIGVRFYFNKSNRDNGFFLLPKIGMNIFAVKGKDYAANKETLSAIVNFYISGEMGFKIDMFTKMGANWPVRPFIDISLLDLGYSFTHGIRFVPLPRLAIGITF
ncbi:hypothetical protein DQ06_12585 [Brachyspira hampsonii bv. II]|nr:hypothetical protein DQ06_12585 [Brachyspira hampsonii bv. II]